MRFTIITLLFAATLILTGIWKVSADLAFAVVETPTSEKQVTEPSQKVQQLTQTKIDIPVFWQLTRTSFLSKGMAAKTESFREVWTLQTGSQGNVVLISPRSQVPVYKTNLNPTNKYQIPDSVILLESDFAKLIGVSRTDWNEDAEVDSQRSKLVTLVISKPPKGGVEMTLDLSDDERFAVYLDLGTPTRF